MKYLKSKEVPKSSVAYDKKYLIFTLGNERYAIDILAIKEIRGDLHSLPLTHISDMPAHIIGIIYIHNLVIPVIDLQLFYHFNIGEVLEKKDIMILISIQTKLMGLVVHSVPDIIELSSDQLKPVPEISTIINQNYIECVGILDNELVIVLNVEKLVLSEELQLGKHMIEAASYED